MKNIKRIAAALLVLVMALALTACGKVEFDGKWKVTGGTVIESLLEGTDVDSLDAVGMELTYEFKDENTLISSVSVLGSTETNEFSYEFKDDTLTIYDEDFSLIFEKMN